MIELKTITPSKGLDASVYQCISEMASLPNGIVVNKGDDEEEPKFETKEFIINRFKDIEEIDKLMKEHGFERFSRHSEVGSIDVQYINKNCAIVKACQFNGVDSKKAWLNGYLMYCGNDEVKYKYIDKSSDLLEVFEQIEAAVLPEKFMDEYFSGFRLYNTNEHIFPTEKKHDIPLDTALKSMMNSAKSCEYLNPIVSILKDEYDRISEERKDIIVDSSLKYKRCAFFGDLSYSKCTFVVTEVTDAYVKLSSAEGEHDRTFLTVNKDEFHKLFIDTHKIIDSTVEFVKAIFGTILNDELVSCICNRKMFEGDLQLPILETSQSNDSCQCVYGEHSLGMFDFISADSFYNIDFSKRINEFTNKAVRYGTILDAPIIFLKGYSLSLEQWKKWSLSAIGAISETCKVTFVDDSSLDELKKVIEHIHENIQKIYEAMIE